MSPFWTSVTLSTIFQTFLTQCLVLYGMHSFTSVGTSNPPLHRQQDDFPFQHHERSSQPTAIPLRYLQRYMKGVESKEDLIKIISKGYNLDDFHHSQSITSPGGRVERSAIHRKPSHHGGFARKGDLLADEKHSYIYANQPPYLDEVPEEHLANLVESEMKHQAERYQADEPDDADLEAFEAALHHIEEMSTCSAARCKEPQPFVQFMYDSYNRNLVFMPQCTILHRCMNFTGCCGDSSRECVPKKINIVHRAFLVMDLLSGNGDYVMYNPTDAKMIALVNHTECECREKPRLKRCTKECPVPFRLMREGHECMCNCYTKAHEDHWQCEGVKEGVVPLSRDGLVCIKENRCYSPVCTVGEFVVKTGFCPLSDDYSLQPYLFKDPEERRHYRKHLKGFDFQYKLNLPPKAYVQHKNGKISPRKRVSMRGLSKKEKDKRMHKKRFEILKKSITTPTKSTLPKKEEEEEIQINVNIIHPNPAQSQTGTKTENDNIKNRPPKRHKGNKNKKKKYRGTFSSKDFLNGRVDKNNYFHGRKRSPSTKPVKSVEKVKKKEKSKSLAGKTQGSEKSLKLNASPRHDNMSQKLNVSGNTTTNVSGNTKSKLDVQEYDIQPTRPASLQVETTQTVSRTVDYSNNDNDNYTLNLHSSSTSTLAPSLSSWSHSETSVPPLSNIDNSSFPQYNQPMNSHTSHDEKSIQSTSIVNSPPFSTMPSTISSPQRKEPTEKIASRENPKWKRVHHQDMTSSDEYKWNKMHNDDSKSSERDAYGYDESELTLKDDSRSSEGSGGDYEN